jgi:hypothetical protein
MQPSSARSRTDAAGMSCPVCRGPRTRDFDTVDDRRYLRCEDCEATFMDAGNLPGRNQELAQYRLHRNHVDDPAYRAFLARLATPLLQRIERRSRGLDYGCGPGPALAAMLGAAGHDVALYDPLFFPDQSVLQRRYDFITCTETVEHFHQPAAEFERLDRLLHAGGWLAIMTTFQTDDARFRNWHYRRDPTHVVFYREHTLRRIADLHGWHCEIPTQNVALMRKA